MDTLWTATTSLPVFAPLRGHVEAEVAIAGAGIAGITAEHGGQVLEGGDHRVGEDHRRERAVHVRALERVELADDEPART